IALFDLHKALGFAPTKIGLKKKIAIAFGARGRGSAVAHFEPGSFTINLTRYKRPRKLANRPAHFDRVKLLLHGGGVGSFAHEYGHALDYYGALKVERGNTFTLSGDKNTNPKPTAHLKQNTLKGLMERLLNKIFWKTPDKYSDYYTRLLKATKQKYFKQRNEIFARAFEVYVQYKLAKKKHVNIFLNEVKYDKDFYLTLNEMKKIEKEFDALMNALKKHL
ncbi:MAG: LPD1 domain-containing protein, partial [Bacteroidia bacterium]